MLVGLDKLNEKESQAKEMQKSIDIRKELK